MQYGLTVNTAAGVTPVTIAEAKAHLRVDFDDDNAYIRGLIHMATDISQAMTGRAWVNTVYDMTLDGFPSGRCIELPRSPGVSVESITYRDEDDASQTLSSSLYSLDASSLVPVVYLKQSESWPSTRADELATVTVTFTAGHGTATTDVPEAARTAIRMLVEHAYKFRGSVIQGAPVHDVPGTVESLLSSLKVPVVP